MNYNHYSLDNRTRNFSLSSSSNYPSSNNHNVSYFSREEIRAGFSSADSSRREFFRNPNPNPNSIRESFQRELEKEKIRAEIIAEEAYRRRILEDEVRRELMLERELAARRRGERELGIGSSMEFESRVPLLTNFEHRIGGSPLLEARSERLPFQRDPVIAGNAGSSDNPFSLGVRLKEIKELKGFVPDVNNEKAVILAKPDESDLKRKVTGPPIGSADPSNGSKKPKSQEEWSCALCRITATSEQALKDHLRGKKHKSRANGLNSQRTGFGTVPLPMTGNANAGKPIVVPMTGNANKGNLDSRKEDKKAGGEASSGKVDKAPAQNFPGIDDKTITLPGKETSVKKGNKEAVKSKKKPASAKPKKQLKFVCEICQVSAHSIRVINAHKRGKRHLAKVKGLNKIDDAASKEMPAPKKFVVEDNKDPNMAASVDKGVVEENNNLCIAVKETVNETPAQKGADEENKEGEVADMAADVDEGIAEENNELCITAAKEIRNEITPAQKGADEENKRGDEADMAADVDEGNAEENNELCSTAAKEIRNEITPAQKVADEETKEGDEADMAADVDGGKAEENNELCNTAAKEIKNEAEGEQVESNKASADHNVIELKTSCISWVLI